MKEKHNKQSWVTAVGMATSIGFILVSCLGAGLMLGRLADTYFSVGPWGTIIGILLGMISGMWATYKRLMGVM